MTDTITPEERAQWRKENAQWHGMWPGEDSEIIIRLLDALEAAEAKSATIGYMGHRPCLNGVKCPFGHARPGPYGCGKQDYECWEALANAFRREQTAEKLEALEQEGYVEARHD